MVATMSSMVSEVPVGLVIVVMTSVILPSVETISCSITTSFSLISIDSVKTGSFPVVVCTAFLRMSSMVSVDPMSSDLITICGERSSFRTVVTFVFEGLSGTTAAGLTV